MASQRNIRRFALLTLYQLDLRGEAELEEIASGLDELAQCETPESEPSGAQGGLDMRRGDLPILDGDERAMALELARGAFAARRESDLAVTELAPTWPSHRQPAIDRAILRLAIFEMRSGRTSPKAAVNEAIELAKRYSTEQSPSFVNGVLDKILKRVLEQDPAESSRVAAPAETPVD